MADCPTQKIQFQSERAARGFAKHYKRNKQKLRVYLCPHCHLWHTTTEKAFHDTLK